MNTNLSTLDYYLNDTQCNRIRFINTGRCIKVKKTLT